MAEDYEANRMVQLAQLEQLGYATDAVANGEEVIRALAARDYDVVLLDIGMPVLDGVETARRIRARRRARQPFLVAVTAGTAAVDRAKFKSAGFDVETALGHAPGQGVAHASRRPAYGTRSPCSSQRRRIRRYIAQQLHEIR